MPLFPGKIVASISCAREYRDWGALEGKGMTTSGSMSPSASTIAIVKAVWGIGRIHKLLFL